MGSFLPWLKPVVGLAAVVALLSVASALLADPIRHFEIGSLGSVQFVLNTNAASLTSAMSVLIALVLLSVQLTAQRYSFSVIGVFVQSPVHALMIGFIIVTITFNLWLGLVLKDEYIPTAGTLLALGMTTVCFGLLPPYIGYLFGALRPDSFLDRLQRQFGRAVAPDGTSGSLDGRRTEASDRIGQIGDVARTAVSFSDGAVARHSAWVLYGSAVRYVEIKRSLPPAWFAVGEGEYRGRHELVVEEIRETGTWLERRVLDELHELFYATLNKLHDVNNTVALVTRQLGEQAIERDDEALARLTMKFMNTYLREAINQGDVRAGYHALYQYRLLADAALGAHSGLALEIADRIRYYGDAATGGPLLWMSAAAAYDLRILAEECARRRGDPAITAQIVEKLIDTVRRAEARTSPALPQLHKTVAGLGSFFLLGGQRDLALLLRQELDRLPAPALGRIGQELAAVDDPVFWELTDRVVNFDYVEEPVRAMLPTFLAPPATWEPSGGDGRPPTPASSETRARASA